MNTDKPPFLLVYTHKITPRIKYIFRHLCTRILRLPVEFTTTIEDFIAHASMKMSYTSQALGKEFHVRSHNLLFEQGLSDLEITVHQWEDSIGFFSTNERSNLPYDIFAASFFLLSRYEEYLPQVKDHLGRFVPTESLAFKNGFLEQPVVDIWTYRFKKALSERFPDYVFAPMGYSVQPVIDVPVAYQYKLKGLVRTVGGSLKDLFKFSFSDVYKRYSVLFGFKKDPLEVYKYLINLQKQVDFKFLFFFMIGEYSTLDKGTNINRKPYQSLIKTVGDYSKTGLYGTFFSVDDPTLIKREKKSMEAVVNRSLEAIRFSHNFVQLPETYRHLIELEIPKAYTMGYQNTIGFRAGTCSTFLFYDLDFEVQTPLKICPFLLTDEALERTKSFQDQRAHIEKLIKSVKRVNGKLTFVFSNKSFSHPKNSKDYKTLFNLILASLE